MTRPGHEKGSSLAGAESTKGGVPAVERSALASKTLGVRVTSAEGLPRVRTLKIPA